jgi:ApeA N-terminal domain 1
MGEQTLACDGRWHLADEATADNLIPGRLKVSQRRGGRLKLYGSLARTSRGDITPEHHRIVGQVGRRPWTLENCFPLRWSPINDEPERWYVELALSGVALDGGQELYCDMAIVRMRHLMGFIGQSGLRMDHPDRRKPFDGTLHVSELPTGAHHYSGGTISIKHQLHVTGSGEIDQANIEQDFGIRLDFNDRPPYREAIAAIGDVQDLLSMATDQTAEYKKLILISNDVPMQMLSGPHPTWKEEIEVYAGWRARSDKDQRELWPHEYVFQLADIGGGTTLAAWMDYSEQFRLITRRVMATRYATSMLVSDRFSNRIAALEAWDLKKTGGRKGGQLLPRLGRLTARLGSDFENLVGDLSLWTKLVLDTRNGVAHHDEGILEGRSSDQYALAESLYWLYVMLVLKSLDADAAALSRLVKHPQLVHWSDRIRRVVFGT